MSRVKELKKQLGAAYRFQRFVSRREWQSCAKTLSSLRVERTLAILTAGCLQIRAIQFLSPDGPRLGYDVFVKATPDAAEWICYDTPPDAVSLNESDMLAVLDRVVLQNDLSYTDCHFERLMGKVL